MAPLARPPTRRRIVRPASGPGLTPLCPLPLALPGPSLPPRLLERHDRCFPLPVSSPAAGGPVPGPAGGPGSSRRHRGCRHCLRQAALQVLCGWCTGRQRSGGRAWRREGGSGGCGRGRGGFREEPKNTAVQRVVHMQRNVSPLPSLPLISWVLLNETTALSDEVRCCSPGGRSCQRGRRGEGRRGAAKDA